MRKSRPNFELMYGQATACKLLSAVSFIGAFVIVTEHERFGFYAGSSGAVTLAKNKMVRMDRHVFNAIAAPSSLH